MKLAGRTALVTGASSGVGRSLAIGLAKRGCRVVVTARNASRLAEVARLTGGRAVVADLALAGGVESLASEVRQCAPDLSVVVNSAAVQLNYLFAAREPDTLVRDVAFELQTDLVAPIQLTGLLLPALLAESRRSRAASAIVNLSSGLVLAPKKTAAVYCAAKAGLSVFGQALRFQTDEERGRGGGDVRVVEVMLPLVDTPMTAGRGRGKISADQAARAILDGLERERNEINVGKVRALRLLKRLLPGLATNLFRNS